MSGAPEAWVHEAWRRARVSRNNSGGGVVDILEEENMWSFAGVTGGHPRVEHVEGRRPSAVYPSSERLDGVAQVAPRHHPLVNVSRIPP